MLIFVLSRKLRLIRLFLSPLFLISEYSPPFRLDRTANGGGSLLYVREHILSKLLDHKGITSDKDFECLFIEINLHGSKWLIVEIYNPSKLLLGKNFK